MVSSIFFGLLGLFFIFLSVYTIMGRRTYHVSIGHENNINMLRRMRAHANFAEYTPLFLLTLYLAEVDGLNHISIYILGSLFLFGRILHAYAILIAEQNSKVFFRKINFRIIGMALTFINIAILSIYLIVNFIMS